MAIWFNDMQIKIGIFVAPSEFDDDLGRKIVTHITPTISIGVKLVIILLKTAIITCVPPLITIDIDLERVGGLGAVITSVE